MTAGSRVFATAVLVLSLGAGTGMAQDPFEIHVYEYETLAPRRFTFETHLNYVGVGSHRAEPPVAATNRQFHMTFELTAGIHETFSVGFMQLNGRRPGSGLEYAGWRVLPHFYAPEKWKLPVKLGLVTEFSFQKSLYEENTRRVELRPIIEKSFGTFQIDLNPVFERALHGPGTRTGWNFEPAARIAYRPQSRFSPSLEYYSATGPFPTELPVHEQIHQFLPGGDWKIAKDIVWSFGVGVGATATGNRLVYKSRVEIEFGREGARH